MKTLSIVFGTVVVGIVVTFGLAVNTAIQEHRVKSEPVPMSIPTPAVPAR